jgi:hypothetical protein
LGIDAGQIPNEYILSNPVANPFVGARAALTFRFPAAESSITRQTSRKTGCTKDCHQQDPR